MGKDIPTKESVFNSTRTMISDFIQCPEDKIELNTSLVEIGLDSLDMDELAIDLEFIFDISIIDNDELENCKTVNDLVELLIKEINNSL